MNDKSVSYKNSILTQLKSNTSINNDETCKSLQVSSVKTDDKIINMKILEEDIYLEHLDQIIERDYFPEIKKYRKLFMKDKMAASQKSNFTNNISMLGLTDNLTSTHKSTHDVKTDYSTRSINSEYVPFTDSIISNQIEDTNKDSEVLEQKIHINAYTLTSFLNRYTSEDNASFSELLEKAKKLKMIKYPWFYRNQGLSIEEGSTKNVFSIENKSPINDNNSSANSIMVPIPDKNNENNYSQSRVVFANTRMLPQIRLSNDPSDNGQLSGSLLDRKSLARVVTRQFNGIHVGKIGPDGKEILSTSAINAKPILEGRNLMLRLDENLSSNTGSCYKLIPQTPELSASQDATPLMTWGNIAQTPLIQDRMDRDDFLAKAFPSIAGIMPIRGFSMPDITPKEKLALKMTEKMTKRSKEEKLKYLKHQSRIFTPHGINSPFSKISTPSMKAYNLESRFKNLSPAAYKLVSSNKLRINSLKIYSGNKTPKIRSKDSYAKERTDKVSSIVYNTPKLREESKHITDNLLKLPDI
ncbi:unnamed protein product [Gordionus sp. m RMFG-2023]|uniref:splicing factor ESS-2-like n=1 Tax=Gordionus sp. m RMFG-2023 TaxID=3053472 RepID=UPI0030E440C4